MERLSFSQLETLASCPEKYRLQRIVHVPERPAWALLGGSAVHSCTEQADLLAHGVTVASDDGTVLTAPESFATVLERGVREAEEKSGMPRSEFRASGRYSRDWPDKENERWWLVNGPAMVERWNTFIRNAPWDLWIDPNGRPGVEIEFDLILDEIGVDVKGFIDRVFQFRDDPDALIVLDLKSGASSPPTPRQLGTYKHGLAAAFPGTRVQFGTFWSARTGSTGEPTPLNEYDRERLVFQYGATKEIRRKGLYLPAPSNMCGSCSVKDYCYELDGERANEVRRPWVPVDEWEEGVDVA